MIRNPVTGKYYPIRECSSKIEKSQMLISDIHCNGCSFEKYVKYIEDGANLYVSCPVEEKQKDMICCERYRFDYNYKMLIKIKKLMEKDI